MLSDKIKRQLQFGGYRVVPTGKQPYQLMVKEGASDFAVCLIEDTSIFKGQLQVLDSFLARVREALKSTYGKSYELLALTVSEDIGRDRWMADCSYPLWFIELSGRRVVFDNQPARFGDVETLLEKKVYPWSGIFTESGSLPYATLGIVLINLAVQIIVAWQERGGRGSGLLYAMVLYIGDFMLKPEYYRLLTSAFLHFGWDHLINNMIVLVYLGKAAEHLCGRGKFIISYLICAIGANAASAAWYIWSGQPEVYTAGASGAVFGVAGMLLALVIFCKGRPGQVTTRQLVWMMLFTIYHGLAESGINNCAHIAGAVLGFACGLVIWMFFLRRKEGEKQ